MGKEQLEAQSATSATSTTAEFALRFNFFILKHCASSIGNESLENFFRLIAPRFQFFFLINSAMPYIELNFVQF